MREDATGDGHVSLVLVSHSAVLAAGLAELVAQVAGPHVAVLPVGGAADGTLGTDGRAVRVALERGAGGAGCVVLTDIGSTVLAVRSALSELAAPARERLRVVDAPLVEGAIAAGVSASVGASLADVERAAQEARHILKL